MNKEVISSKQAICILTLYQLSNLVIGISPKAEQDTWITFLLGLVIYTPILLTEIRIVSLYPGKNLYDIGIEIFGNVIGRIIAVFYIVYAIHLSSIHTKIFMVFMNIVALPNTPQTVILIFLLLFSVWMVKSGTEALGRWCRFLLPVVVLGIIAIFVIGLKDMNFRALKPVGGSDFGKIMDGTFSAHSNQIAEAVLFLTIFSSIKTTDKPYKIYITGVAIGALGMLMTTIQNITLLGVPSFSMFYFPTYKAVSITSVGDFFTRFEVVIGLIYIITGLVKIFLTLYATSIGMARLFTVNNYKTMAFPAGLLMATLANFFFKNTVQLFEWAPIYRYVYLDVQVILPLIILAGAEIKNLKRKLTKTTP